ncbi:MAG TPA: hypothetical protein VGY97_11345 [Solirubrobacteraceae bacterium]|jgi:hypothetical protein|nr:hypothetical protein [Solirubrobacteraceae bacterium]
MSDLSDQPVTAPAATADTASVLHDPLFDDSLIAELQRGERLLWSGQPDTGRWFVPDVQGRLQMSLAAGAFMIFLAAIILTSNLRSGVSAVGLFFSLGGALFAALGLYLIAGRVIVRRYFGRRTAYGLTNLRALVIKPTWRGGCQTAFVWLASGPAVNQRIRPDGHGTVWIGATIYQQAAWFAGDPGWYVAKPYERQLVTFWNIADAADVSRLAARLISEAETISGSAPSPH